MLSTKPELVSFRNSDSSSDVEEVLHQGEDAAAMGAPRRSVQNQEGAKGEPETLVGAVFADKAVPSKPRRSEKDWSCVPKLQPTRSLGKDSYSKNGKVKKGKFWRSQNCLTGAITASKDFVHRWCCSCTRRDRLKELVSDLQADAKPERQLVAVKAIMGLALSEENRVNICENPQALAALVALLFKDDNPVLQNHGTLTLGVLAGVHQNALKMAQQPSALEGLIRLLPKDFGCLGDGKVTEETDVTLQQQALSVLALISYVPEAGRMIVENPSAMENLIDLFDAESARDAYEGPAEGMLLDNLCKTLSRLSQVPQNAETIAHSGQFERALRGLLGLLIKSKGHKNYALQKSAVLTLSNLSATEEIQIKIADYPGILEEVALCLYCDEDPLLVEYAAMALGNLALAQNNGLKIVDCHKALPALVDLLFRDANPDGQEHAAWALANLSHAHEANQKIAECPAAVGGLIHLMSKTGSPNTQEQAARALANLTCLSENELMFSEFPNAGGLVTGLVTLLSQHKHTSLQKEAIKAFANLTVTYARETHMITKECVANLGDLVVQYSKASSPMASMILESAAIALGNLALQKENKQKVGNCEDAFAGLLGLLLRFEDPIVQKEAAWALGNLFHEWETDDAGAVAETKGPRAIPYLGGLLLKDDIPLVQEEATMALANLSYFPENQAKIIEFPGALMGVVSLLSKHDNPNIQYEAVRMLSNLTRAKEYWLKIADFPGVLAGLTLLLSFEPKNESPDLQRTATMCLCNLALAPKNVEKIVRFPNAVSGVQDLLFMGQHGAPLLEQAAIFFQNIASCPNTNDHRFKFSEFPRVLEGLEALLYMNYSPAVQLQSLKAFVNLNRTPENQQTVLESLSVLPGMIKLLTHDANPDAQVTAAAALHQLSVDAPNVQKLLSKCPTASILAGLLGLLYNHGTLAQEVALVTLSNLAQVREYQLEIAEFPNALADIAELCTSDNVVVVEYATMLLRVLTSAQENLSTMAEVPDIAKCLKWLLSDCKQPRPIFPSRETKAVENHTEEMEGGCREGNASKKAAVAEESTQEAQMEKGCTAGKVHFAVAGSTGGSIDSWAAMALTFIDPAGCRELTLHSGESYAGRGSALFQLGMFEEALGDFNVAMDLQPENAGTASIRSCVKSLLQDYEGALVDANKGIDLDPNCAGRWQERGILKRLLGDLEGALADLNKALEMERVDYEVLKHRGYVRYLMGDEAGARKDAEWATRIKLASPEDDEPQNEEVSCLGELPVEFLDYKL